MTAPPNRWLLPEYRLSCLCRNRQIDAIVRLIAAVNPNLMSVNSDYQLYAWAVMSHAINAVIPEQVWTWINSAESDVDIGDIDTHNGNGEGLYEKFEKTYEIVVCPIESQSKAQKILKSKKTNAEQQIQEQTVQTILKQIIKDIKVSEIMSNAMEYYSGLICAPLLNYKIVRFSNESAVSEVRTKVIARLQRKYKRRYDIKFTKLSNASKPSSLLCGFVPLNDPKSYVLDMSEDKKSFDPSPLLREI